MRRTKSFLPRVSLLQRVWMECMILKQPYVAVEEEEEDKVDSDFDLDSSEGEQEHIEEGEAMDKEIDKAEKRVSP